TALRSTMAGRSRRQWPAIALLDLQLDDHISGVDFIRPLVDLGVTVIMLTGVTDRLQLAACVEAGACALASKTNSLDRLLETIDAVARAEPVITEDERAALMGDLRRHRAEEAARLGPFDTLTRREQEVLAAILEGKKAEEIAAASYVSIATVR